jgi:hypothetical protein
MTSAQSERLSLTINVRFWPDGSAIAEMLADYNVMREQARACE